MANKVTLEQLDKKIDKVDKKHDDNFAKLFNYLHNNFQDDLVKKFSAKFATKNEFRELQKSEDKEYTILKKLDQERLFTYERIKRLEADVAYIKNHLGIK